MVVQPGGDFGLVYIAVVIHGWYTKMPKRRAIANRACGVWVWQQMECPRKFADGGLVGGHGITDSG